MDDHGKIIAYIDGSCQPRNPGGIATCGILILKDDERIHHDARFIIEGAGASNNVAEYSALNAALEWLLARKMTSGITIRADSRLVIDQMTGKMEARKGLYMKYHDVAATLVKQFPGIKFEWVPREKNAVADALSRKAYEERCKATGKKIMYMKARD